MNENDGVVVFPPRCCLFVQICQFEILVLVGSQIDLGGKVAGGMADSSTRVLIVVIE